MVSASTVNELLAVLQKLTGQKDDLRQEFESRLAEIEDKCVAIQKTLDLLSQESDTPDAEPQEPALPPPVPLDHLARQLRGLTQVDALRQIAVWNGGIVRTRDARRLFVSAGLTKGKLKNLPSHIYHILLASEEFERVAPGAFRLKSAVDALDQVREPAKAEMLFPASGNY